MKTFRKKEFGTGTVKAFLYDPKDSDLKKNLKEIKVEKNINDKGELVLEVLPASKYRLIVVPNVMVCITKKKDGTSDYFTMTKTRFSEQYVEVAN